MLGNEVPYFTSVPDPFPIWTFSAAYAATVLLRGWAAEAAFERHLTKGMMLAAIHVNYLVLSSLEDSSASAASRRHRRRVVDKG